ncbi:MAG TPA: hypothetical protein VF782_06745 [Allosphingosinicella sp.]
MRGQLGHPRCLADWDSAAQDWWLGAVFDYAFCHDCEEETSLVEVDLATREPTGR